VLNVFFTGRIPPGEAGGHKYAESGAETGKRQFSQPVTPAVSLRPRPASSITTDLTSIVKRLLARATSHEGFPFVLNKVSALPDNGIKTG